jgi:hypothetical protein
MSQDSGEKGKKVEQLDKAYCESLIVVFHPPYHCLGLKFQNDFSN